MKDVSTSADTVESQTSDYDLYYPQFVDSKEPLAAIKEKDVATLNGWDISNPVLSHIPDENRVDYFDVAYGTDPLQKLDIHHLKGDMPRPVMFYIHGGGWYSGDKNFSRFIGLPWISCGYTVVSINYRLLPQSEYPAQIEDCACALKWVMGNIDKYCGDPDRIAVVGDSAGGHLAALLVTGNKWHEMYDIDISKVKCCIPVSGIHDLSLKENYYCPMMIDIGNMFNFEKNKVYASPVTHITGNEPPCLIIHGGDDWLVPKTNSIELYNRLREKGFGTELVIVEHYWHCNMTTHFGRPGHKPTEIINRFLAKYFPAEENKESRLIF